MPDNIVEYQVAITKSGTGATDAANDLERLRTAAGTTTGGLKDLRESAMLTHESSRVLAETAMLAGGNLGEFGKSALIASEGMRAARTAAMLFGTSIETMLPVVGAIAAVVAAGALGWSAWENEQKKAIASQNELTSSMREMPELLKRINDATKDGALTPAQSQAMLQQLGAAKGNPDVSKLSLAAPQNYSGNAQLPQGFHISTGPMGIPDAIDIAKANEELAKTGELLRVIDDKGKISYVDNPAKQALAAQNDLITKMNSERLTGFAKERQTAEDTYNAEIEKLKQIAGLENYIKDPADRKTAQDANASAQTQAAGVRDNSVGNINAKEQADSEKQIREADARDAAEQIKALESSITLFQAQQGAVRTSTVQAEYQKRIALADSLYFSGTIGEQQYTDMV